MYADTLVLGICLDSTLPAIETIIRKWALCSHMTSTQENAADLNVKSAFI